MPRGFMLYVSAAAVGLLGFGQPVPAEASDASQGSALTTAGHDTAATAATAPILQDSASSIVSSIASTASSPVSSISVTMTPSSASPSIASTPIFDTETCQSKTINYITHTLPQQCLRTSWSSANATSTTPDAGGATGTNESTDAAPAETAAAAAAQNATEPGSKDDDENPEDLATGSFMSFEEWKVLQLKKAGQDPAELQARRRQQQQQQQQQYRAGQNAHNAGGDVNIDSIGDDGEIALDFDVLNEKVSEMAGSASAQAPGQYYGGSGWHDGSAGGDAGGDARSAASTAGSGSGSGSQDDAVVYADGATQYYRSKDAGKTGKERFSFASFDAGATILKTNKGVKNAKAILVENKDSYMLLECRARDKYVVVEMSDDILVDTVVLANFEFFSSMVRRFRVSVSDRYPVKADRWRALGEYEARNSRDIQPFLIEHPQIWAKYIRIDFLTHYGSEYYCPISLLRVHGTRMLDSWKDSENGRDGEEDELEYLHQQATQHGQKDQQAVQEETQPEAVHHEPTHDEPRDAPPVDPQIKTVDEATACDPAGFTPWNPIAAYFRLFVADTVCLLSAAPAGDARGSFADAHAKAASALQCTQTTQGSDAGDEPPSAPSPSSHSSAEASSSPGTKHTQSADKAASPSPHTQSGAKDTPSPSPSSSSPTPSNASPSSDAASSSQPSASSLPQQDAAAAVPPSGKSKTASSQKAPASPGTHGNEPVPPTTTVQTPQSKNRAVSGGSGGAGGSSQASGSTGGAGSNPGATPGGGSSASAGGSGNNGPAGGAPPPPPIVQEGFFKSITKRLQLLESNTSLSLQYIEDQSRFLQDALRKMERKQIARVDSFLDTLNNTVLSELRNMRQQYDQIWQSTVIALETQREQNQRETVALSDRLNILADEVVFQKRMAILQSVLLLCCLALVIFSRGLLSGPPASVPLDAVAAAAPGYMPMHMSPSPSSPPSGSSPSVGLRSNLRALRNNLRNPYAAYSVHASGYPLSAYSAGSPPPPSTLRSQSMPVGSSSSDPTTSNGNTSVPVAAPVNMNKVLPLTPTTPTSPGSPVSSPESRNPLLSNESQDSLLSVEENNQTPPLVAPKPLTTPASLRLSDIEEAADQMEDDDDTADSDDATVLSEATTARPGDDGGDDLRLFTPRAVTPTAQNRLPSLLEHSD